MNDLQDLVDALAAELDRPVGVDDRRFRAVVYSSHEGEVDPVRRESILRREAPASVTSWLASLGIERETGHLRVPANAELGMVARVCLPVRFQGTLLAYLWLLDEPEPLTAPELQIAERGADRLALELYRLRLADREEAERDADAVRRLLGLIPAREGTAVDTGLAAAGGYTVLVAAPQREDEPDGGGPVPPEVRVRLAAAVEQARRRLPPRHLLALAEDDEVIAVVALAADRGGDAVREAVGALHAAGTAALADQPGWTVLVGAGGVRRGVDGLAAAHTEACAALRLARAVPAARPLALWSDLGATRTILRLLGDGDPAAALPEALRRLLAASDGDTLIATLECYLDHAGDAKATAAELYIHRSSLYHRLHRAEEIAGVSLHSGDDRLELHLGLRLWRMTGGADAPAG